MDSTRRSLWANDVKKSEAQCAENAVLSMRMIDGNFWSVNVPSNVSLHFSGSTESYDGVSAAQSVTFVEYSVETEVSEKLKRVGSKVHFGT